MKAKTAVQSVLGIVAMQALPIVAFISVRIVLVQILLYNGDDVQMGRDSWQKAVPFFAKDNAWSSS